MSQFASTLYPQTNPSNPVLLRFRAINNHHAMSVRTSNWLAWMDGPLPWALHVVADPKQIDHARRVLTRLASFSG